MHFYRRSLNIEGDGVSADKGNRYNEESRRQNPEEEEHCPKHNGRR